MPSVSSYLRLLRLHQPTGIWLLLWPCWWGIALASEQFPDARLLMLFFLGAAVMRAAGCIINDMADREFDRQVERTSTRPLANGEISLKQAGLLLLLLLCAALGIALFLPRICLWLAAASLPLVITYPFMKRITWWPQLFLGLTFNWGALMGWAAVTGDISLPALALYSAGIFWTLGYDTIYAHQDKADDMRIGVKSSALRLGTASRLGVALFYAASLACLISAGYLVHASASFYGCMALAGMHFAWQVSRVDFDNPASCMKIFRSNAWLGGWIFFSLVLAKNPIL